jgi:hypothetical protein
LIFLNSTLLIALGAVAVPIIIHLIHRRKANVLEWGAMQFLRASVAARQRRTIVEELILMVLRCLLVALLVMAAARPFVPADSRLPWGVVLPLCLAGVVCAAVAAVVRTRPLARWGVAALAVLLTGSSGLLAARELVHQGGRWSGGAGGQDIALVIDGSASMQYSKDGRSNFERALDEARALVEACRSDDTLTVILADAAPHEAVVGPTADHGLVLAALDTLAPNAGTARVLPALDLAAAALSEGQNATGKIVFITDGQDAGWSAGSEARWQFLAGSFAQLPTQPELICRVLDLPAEYANLSVAEVMASRRVIGTDRPVSIDARIANYGTRTSAPCPVEMRVDEGPPERRNVGALEPGGAETVRFRHRFAEPGRRVVSVHVPAEDDLPVDDLREIVVSVVETLPVLIVDGEPSARPLDSVADFMALALAPVGDAPGAASLVAPRVVPLTGIASHRDFAGYRVVILADCARLPSVQAAALAVFVRNGGGLLIAAGERCDPAFYAAWSAGEQGPVAPARLIEFQKAPGDPVRPAPDTFAHPALDVIADREASDADAALFDRYWRVEADEADPAVRTAALLENGDPLMVERKVGAGFVALTTVPLGRSGGNLPTLKCFVPLLHELTYYLAAPTADEPTVDPGTAVALSPGPDGAAVDVITPDGERVPVMPAGSNGPGRFEATAAPGVYRIVAGADPEADDAGTAFGGEVFAVRWTADESALTPLSAEDIGRIGARVPLFVARTTGEMTAALTGNIPGEEVWKQLVACALLTLLAEVLVARWITVQRRSHAPSQVTFGAAGPQPQDLRAHLGGQPAPGVEREEAIP